MSVEVRKLVERYLPDFPVIHCGEIYTDTSGFMNISYGDVIAVGGLHYMVFRDEAERRFGMEDPKYWVKRCQVLETGERRILKLVFYESFPMKIGPFVIRCHRSAEKEGRILDLVRNDRRFMQGVPMKDEKGNLVRVLDLIRGKRLDVVVDAIPVDHRTYFHEFFPGILEKFIGSCEAIAFLHSHEEKHGDIRRDHLWVESGTGDYRWIDFDYAFDFFENPFGLDLFGLGNILLFLVGKGHHTSQRMRELGFGEDVLKSLPPEDFSLMFHYRLVNLRKLYSYIPEELNRVLMHFSVGANVFYETVDELLEGLYPCLDLVSRL
ncbi:MAG: serine/threonine protein kinase [Thermodesulfobacteriota bacterium]|nr:serine/threonine protein kinase [Thermodesulfobacteriota bacterium]